MGKVLISFLGTGRPNMTNGDRPMRDYRPANYQVDDKIYEKISFMSAALAKHYKVDKLLMVGTVHSMWEEAYRWFYDQNNKTTIEDNAETYDIYCEIGSHCEKADHNTELYIPHQEEIEKVLGGDSKVILIKYGITSEEINENITRILGLQEYLSNGDELIVDITHSFRSLPIFIMNLLIYLKNVSSKNITISHIHYGMIEANSEFGNVAPVVDLKAMMEVQEWITGAYAFKQFGNAYKISGLLKNGQTDKDAAPILFDFSQAMNLNYLYSMQRFTQRLAGIKDKDYKSDLAQLIISPVVRSFVDTFHVKHYECPQARFQLKLADWQFKHKKFAQAYLTSNDAMISYVCEINNMSWDDFCVREAAKKALAGKCAKDEDEKCIMDSFSFPPTNEMRKWYKNHNRCRNGIAHTTKVELNNWELFPNEIIKMLDKDIEELKKMIV